jgi:hypothetical protein
LPLSPTLAFDFGGQAASGARNFSGQLVAPLDASENLGAHFHN